MIQISGWRVHLSEGLLAEFLTFRVPPNNELPEAMGTFWGGHYKKDHRTFGVYIGPLFARTM